MSTSTKDARFFAKEVTKYISNDVLGKKITPKVSSLFEKLSARTTGTIAVTVESAVALTETEKRSIERVLEAKAGTNIHTDYLVNEELLMGLKIHAGDVLIDASGEMLLRQYVEHLIA